MEELNKLLDPGRAAKAPSGGKPGRIERRRSMSGILLPWVTVCRVSDNPKLSVMMCVPTSHHAGMPSRRLEDRIRELCARVLCETGPGWEKTAHELHRAIQANILRLANMTTAVTVGGKPEVFIERRRRSAMKIGTKDQAFGVGASWPCFGARAANSSCHEHNSISL